MSFYNKIRIKRKIKKQYQIVKYKLSFYFYLHLKIRTLHT